MSLRRQKPKSKPTTAPKKLGRLVTNGVKLEPHEKVTIDFLRSQKCDIELVPRVSTKSADILMGGVFWEIKAPAGSGKKTAENNLHCAHSQSDSIIIDLFRLGGEEERFIKDVLKSFQKIKSLRRLKIITKSRETIDLKK